MGKWRKCLFSFLFPTKSNHLTSLHCICLSCFYRTGALRSSSQWSLRSLFPWLSIQLNLKLQVRWWFFRYVSQVFVAEAQNSSFFAIGEVCQKWRMGLEKNERKVCFQLTHTNTANHLKCGWDFCIIYEDAKSSRLRVTLSSSSNKTSKFRLPRLRDDGKSLGRNASPNVVSVYSRECIYTDLSNNSKLKMREHYRHKWILGHYKSSKATYWVWWFHLYVASF